ncbi:hypothetical protein AC1031_010000 [Aphanomyces cochlioides]|nr:hypothetical protein AC1031_010000 [Aphanomyces cochlioides]
MLRTADARNALAVALAQTPPSVFENFKDLVDTTTTKGTTTVAPTTTTAATTGRQSCPAERTCKFSSFSGDCVTPICPSQDATSCCIGTTLPPHKLCSGEPTGEIQCMPESAANLAREIAEAPLCHLSQLPSTKANTCDGEALLATCPDPTVSSCKFILPANNDWNSVRLTPASNGSLPSQLICQRNATNFTLSCTTATTTRAPSETASPQALDAPNAAPAASEAKASSSNGATIGGVVGGLAVVIALIAFIFYRRRRRQPNSSGYHASTTPKQSAPASPPALRTPDVIDDQGQVDFDQTKNLLKYLSTRSDLKELWMPVSTLKTTALKGGNHMFTITDQNGKKLALKGIDYATASPETRHGFVQSILSIRSVVHPQITSVAGVTLAHSYTFFCVATEYMERGSIGSVLLDTKTELSTGDKVRMALETTRALLHVHSLGRIYDTLSADKVLVNSKLECKLNVLQLMKAMFDTVPKCRQSYGELTMPFLAPEVRRGGVANESADIYSLGVLLGFIFARKVPFSRLYHDVGFTRGDVYLTLHPDEIPPYDELPGASPELAELIQACWSSIKDRRPTLHSIVQALERENLL